MSRLEIDDYEPYVDDAGLVGLAVADQTLIEIKSLSEWKDEDKKLGEMLEKRLETLVKLFRFPFKPQVDELDDDLHTDLTRYLAEHIWFSDDRYYSVLANWIICTWIQEQLTHATRLCFYGPTNSGKTRAIKCLALLSYRGFHNITPTGPGLFRMIERYHVTMCLDELQDVQKEQRADIDLIIKGGFESGPGVARCNDKGELDFFNVYGPMALGTKHQPREDIENRSLLVCMTQKPSDAELGDRKIKRKVDQEEAGKLRGRLLALRLQVLSGKVDLVPFIAKADEMAQASLLQDGIEGREVFLDDRSIDKASELLVPGVMFKDCDSTLELLAQSENDASQGLRETLEAKIFFALQAVYAPVSMNGAIIKVCDPKTMSQKDVTDQLREDFGQIGDEDEPPKTRTVGRILRLLGFRFKQGHSRASMFDATTFQQAYDANLRKYGMRRGDDDEK